MKPSKLLLLGAILVAICSISAFADTEMIVSGTDVDVIGVYNKVIPGSWDVFVPTSFPAVLADEPTDPNWPYNYQAGGDDGSAGPSIWDNGLSIDLSGTGADWIWETARAEYPATEYPMASLLYDPNATRHGRVVVFERKFDIPSNWDISSANLKIAADNGWEVWINGTYVDQSVSTNDVNEWYLTNLHEESLSWTGWETVGDINVSGYLNVGEENSIVIIAGNEYYWSDDTGYPNGPIPPYEESPTYFQHNPGAMIFALDIEYTPTYSICGAKFEDVDEGEDIPLEGWTINLYDDEDQLIATTTTDANGEYCFTGLVAGDYFVGEGSEEGWMQVYPDDGTDWGYYLTLPDDATVDEVEGPFYDFYNVPMTYSICGAKFEYVEGDDGIPLEGWPIYLYIWDEDAYVPYDDTVTDANGEYCFTGLPEGDYFIEEGSEAGWTQVIPGDPNLGYYLALPDDATVDDLEGPFYDFYNEPVEQEMYCGLTQGFYGNAGGKFYLPDDYVIGIPTTELLIELLDAADAVTPGLDPVVVGDANASLTFDTAACILNRLPAGGPVALLPLDNLYCDDDLVAEGLVKKNKTELNNVLIGQIVALTLNTRLDGNLGYFILPGTEEEDGVFCTAYDIECPQQFVIPKLVIEMLGGEGANVYDLLDLANAAIAEGASKKQLGDINKAVTAINEAFDKCASLVACDLCD